MSETNKTASDNKKTSKKAQEKLDDAHKTAEPIGQFAKEKQEGEAEHNLDPKKHYQFLWPADAPVDILGTNSQGDKYYFYNLSNGIFASRTLNQLNTQGIMSLFGGEVGWLYERFHAWKKDENKEFIPDMSRFEVQRVQALIFLTAGGGTGKHPANIFDPSERVRGSGCWQEGDNLIVHCGDNVFRFLPSGIERAKGQTPGPVGRGKDLVVYCANPALSHISGEKPSWEEMNTAALELIEELRTWNWEEPHESPHLMLGFIISMFLGGALDWRPMVYVIGAGGSGKSKLQDFVYAVLNGWSMYTQSATEAAVRQNLGSKSVPIQYDEAEGTDFTNSYHINEVIGFMRLAAGGSVTHKGTADQQGTEYKMQSCMLMTSIFQPGLTDADRSRIIQLRLNSLELDKMKEWQWKTYAKLGKILISYFCHHWNDFKEQHKIAWEWLFNQGKFQARECDVYAPVIALSFVATVNAKITDDALSGLFSGLSGRLEKEREETEGLSCLAHLLQQMIYGSSGVRETIGYLIWDILDKAEESSYAISTLNKNGIDVDVMGGELFIASSHAQLYNLFSDTRWRATIKGSTGAWRDALLRIKGCSSSRKIIGPQNLRGVVIPLSIIKEQGKHSKT